MQYRILSGEGKVSSPLLPLLDLPHLLFFPDELCRATLCPRRESAQRSLDLVHLSTHGDQQ